MAIVGAAIIITLSLHSEIGETDVRSSDPYILYEGKDPWDGTIVRASSVFPCRHFSPFAGILGFVRCLWRDISTLETLRCLKKHFEGK